MKQTADTVLLIRPSHFGFNPQTAFSNSFQQTNTDATIALKAINEFNAFAERLSRESIATLIFDDIPTRQTPDAVFPNNWITMHENGKIVLYPMEASNRRNERRIDIIESLKERFFVEDVIDLTSYEHKQQYLEGTGSIVFDHTQKIAYMAQSSRSHSIVLNDLCEKIGYKMCLFTSADAQGNPIYHTNVLMSIGREWVVICPECIPDYRTKVAKQLENQPPAIIEITGNQLLNFAGNILEVTNAAGDPFIIISETAIQSLSPLQKRTLEQFATLLPIPIPTIEKHGGGSIRCMMAEVFLPKKDDFINITSPKTNAEFDEYFALRWKILRKPWNRPIGSEKDEQEEIAVHFMATISGKIVGTGRLQFTEPGTVQVRFVAVDSLHEGKGVGRKLMEAMERYAQNQNCHRVFLQARENAVPFYLKSGYTIIEKTFLLFDEIQHFSMEKSLQVK